MKAILTLSLGQTLIDHGFSMNNFVLKFKITEESIVSKKLIRHHITANKLKILNDL